MSSAVPLETFDSVISRADTDSMKWDKYKGRDVLPFWVADMDFAMAQPIQNAIKERLEHPLLGYTFAPADMADAVVDFLLAEYQWRVDPEWLVWLPGVVCGLAASCRAFAEAGDHIVVNPPIYHHFFDSHESHHIIDRLPLRCGNDHRWTWNLEALEERLQQGGVSVIMLCSPHNPTGTVFTTTEIQALMELAAAYNVTVISDEIHCDLVLKPGVKHYPTAHAAPEHRDRTVTLMSGSKTWNLAGLNCSFAVIPDESRREAFKAAVQSTVPPVPPLAFTATHSAYRDGGPWRDSLLQYLWHNYEHIVQRFADIPELVVHPLEATYLAWVDASALGVKDVQGFFEDHGVGLSSGAQFGQDDFVRINFACPRATLDEGLNRMITAVKSTRPS